jgi:hypothetical protein
MVAEHALATRCFPVGVGPFVPTMTIMTTMRCMPVHLGRLFMRLHAH